MKTAWNIITLVALANLIAIVGFVWWLHFSGRLDMGRVEAVRTMLSETISDQTARETAEATEAERAAGAAAEAALMDGSPVTAQETLAMRLEVSEIDRQRLERLKQEVEALSATLARERRLFEQERAAFESEKTGFEAMRERLAAIEGDAQFAKSVAVLETVKAGDAKGMITELLGTDPQQAVAYLNAMKARQRAKVIAEFNKDGSTDVATDLLEKLRLHGLDTGAVAGAGNGGQ